MDFDVDAITHVARRLAAGETLAGDEFTVPLGAFSTDALGVTFDRVSTGRFEAHADLDERHHQPFGLVHGGVWVGIVETVGSVAAQTRVVLEEKAVVGVHNATDFLRAFRSGRVDIVGEPVHIGRTQHLWQVTILRASDGKTIARGQLRVQVIDPATARAIGTS
ncbi:MAG: PaaI family thioesterase [Nitriliruptoraceae bacterium]